MSGVVGRIVQRHQARQAPQRAIRGTRQEVLSGRKGTFEGAKVSLITSSILIDSRMDLIGLNCLKKTAASIRYPLVTSYFQA